MAKLQTKPEPKSLLSRIRDIYPRYADLLVRQSELLARQEAAYAEARPLAERGKRAMESWQAQLPKPKAKPIVRHVGAVALVGDLISEQPAEELNPPAPRPSWDGEDQLRELSAEAEAIQEALKLLAPELTNARRQHSLLVAKERGAEYQVIIGRVVDIVRGLGDAIQEHHAFLNEIRLDAVAWKHFRQVDLTAFGSLDEDGSILMRLVRDAVERGHVSGDKIPKWNPALSLSQLQNLGD
jgi:hypothetical protein